jgi:hypothetical protein
LSLEKERRASNLNDRKTYLHSIAEESVMGKSKDRYFNDESESQVTSQPKPMEARKQSQHSSGTRPSKNVPLYKRLEHQYQQVRESEE